MGGQSGNHGASAISRHLKILPPPSSSSNNNLRISDELARHWDGGDGNGGSGGRAGGTALVVSPFGKIWRVQVGRDADGRAFLGRGWPEFAAAHGFGTGWFLVLRREAGGVLTVKAFDTTCCLREFSRLLTVAANHSGVSRRPQFISVLLPPCMENMVIPPKFVQKYIAEPETGSSMAVLLSLMGKFCRVAIERDQSGNLFFSGGWSRFLTTHGIAEYDVLLLRYEGNMVFTVKVFGPDGCQKGFKDQDTSHSKKFEQSGKTAFFGCQKEFKDQDRSSQELDQSDQKAFANTKTEGEEPPSSSRKRKSTAKKRDGEENSKRLRRCTASSKKALSSTNSSVYEIGPPSWMKSEMSSYILANYLTVAGTFRKAIGLWRTSEITLKTTADDGLRSWQVSVRVYGNRSRGYISRGWRRFCADNRIKEGEICTFNVVETTLWHVDITRRG